MRNIEGTPPSTVASASPSVIASLENFGTSTSRAPLLSVKQAHPKSENKGELQRQQHDIAGADFQQRIEHGELVGKPPVADDDAFGFAGAAGGENNKRGVAQQRAIRRRRLAR